MEIFYFIVQFLSTFHSLSDLCNQTQYRPVWKEFSQCAITADGKSFIQLSELRQGGVAEIARALKR